MNNTDTTIENDNLYIKDKNGLDIFYGSVVEFEFSSLVDDSFFQSNFGALINKISADKCFIHFQDARTFQPDYGWFKTLCYVVYFTKNGKYFNEEDEAKMDGKEFCESNDTYFLYNFDPRFIVYLNTKKAFKIIDFSLEQTLSEEYLKSISFSN